MEKAVPSGVLEGLEDPVWGGGGRILNTAG